MAIIYTNQSSKKKPAPKSKKFIQAQQEHKKFLLSMGISSKPRKDTPRKLVQIEEAPQRKVAPTSDSIPSNGYKNTIDDYKCTSVWSFLFGEKPDWTSQLNSYSYLLRLERNRLHIDIPVTTLRIQAILRDWQKSKIYEKDYPPIAFQVIDLDLWTFEQQEEYIKSRLRDHIQNPHRECTSEEKWQTEDTYAVMKSGQKKALRVLDTQLEAESWLKSNKGDSIIKRSGKCKRCQDYCTVRSVCEFHKTN